MADRTTMELQSFGHILLATSNTEPFPYNVWTHHGKIALVSHSSISVSAHLSTHHVACVPSATARAAAAALVVPNFYPCLPLGTNNVVPNISPSAHMYSTHAHVPVVNS